MAETETVTLALERRYASRFGCATALISLARVGGDPAMACGDGVCGRWREVPTSRYSPSLKLSFDNCRFYRTSERTRMSEDLVPLPGNCSGGRPCG